MPTNTENYDTIPDVNIPVVDLADIFPINSKRIST